MAEEPCELLIRKLREHGGATKCPHCGNVFDVHLGMVFLEGKEQEYYNKWGHRHFEEVMGQESEQESEELPAPRKRKPTKAESARLERTKKLVRERATEIKEAVGSVGETMCPFCQEEAWLFTKKDGTEGMLCPACGYDDLGLDWTDINHPLPRPACL